MASDRTRTRQRFRDPQTSGQTKPMSKSPRKREALLSCSCCPLLHRHCGLRSALLLHHPPLFDVHGDMSFSGRMRESERSKCSQAPTRCQQRNRKALAWPSLHLVYDCRPQWESHTGGCFVDLIKLCASKSFYGSATWGSSTKCPLRKCLEVPSCLDPYTKRSS
jgi:hypothetical protein